MKTSLGTQLKQTNLENWLYILKESPTEDFNDPIFQHFMGELKHCNLDMWMDLQLVPVFLCLYSIYYLQYISPLSQDSLVIFNENLLQSRNNLGENRFHKEKWK